MNDTKFTRGDWAILPAEEDKECLRIRGTLLGGRYKIANVIDLKEHHNGMNWCARERAESMANANLIKTSPKMYMALQSILDSPYTELQEEDFEMIEKVLAEARGEL